MYKGPRDKNGILHETRCKEKEKADEPTGYDEELPPAPVGQEDQEDQPMDVEVEGEDPFALNPYPAEQPPDGEPEDLMVVSDAPQKMCVKPLNYVQGINLILVASILIYGCITITDHDLERLQPGMFLNDTLIEFGLT